MTKLDAAALYAGLNLLILLALSFNVVRGRIRHKVTIGDGGNPAMLRAIRAHANAAEYIPAMLVGLGLYALLDPAPLWSVHALGVAITVGRAAHGYGLATNEGRSAGRAVGTLLTWAVMAVLGGALIWAALQPVLSA